MSTLRLALLTTILGLGGCLSEPPVARVSVSANPGSAHPLGGNPVTRNAFTPVRGYSLIETLLPRHVGDRADWARDIEAAFAALELTADREHVCAVIAVIEQESSFQVDPVIPNLGAIAAHEIEKRAHSEGVPLVLVHTALELQSSDGHTFDARIRSARTERDLSDVYEDFIGQVPLGEHLFAGWNPIRTRGPMQVNVAFAARFAATRSYPYPVKTRLEDELFTRRGSLYFGVAHLLAYDAPYDSYLYRFADYNAGQYASRNAAFQRALALATGRSLTADGALLPRDRKVAGTTEAALLSLSERLRLGAAEIHQALDSGDSERFEQTPVYARVLTLAEQQAGHPLPRARVPDIRLTGPKITRALTTRWYAKRVYARFQLCEHPPE
jgi:hypothetical protein